MRQKKHIIRWTLAVVMIGLAIYFIHENSRVRFQDINMGITICEEAGYGVTVEDIRYRDLDKVKWLYIAVEKYKTLQDIKKCNKLKELTIDGQKENGRNTYIENLDILIECKKLEEVGILYIDMEDYSVLSECSRLREVDLTGSSIKEAKDLLELKELERIWLEETPLAENEVEMDKLKKAFPKAEIISTR